jgi:hypothetical protein
LTSTEISCLDKSQRDHVSFSNTRKWNYRSEMLQFRFREHIAACDCIEKRMATNRSRSPDPADQAEVVLEIQSRRYCEAQEIVVTNFKFAKRQEDCR